MKKIFLGLTLLSAVAMANDGGMAAIKVDAIRMREVKYDDMGKEVTVKSFTNPSHKIIIEGKEALKLQKILPPTVSVITMMQPELAKSYAESFRALGIYSDDSKVAKSKVLSIDCSDAELKTINEKTGKMGIVKTGKPTCTISIYGSENGAAGDNFGDIQDFEPKVCK